MIILVKFPTRGRPNKFFQTLDLYYSKAQSADSLVFLVSCDLDDKTMNNSSVLNKLSWYKNLFCFWGRSSSKVEAINRDIGEFKSVDFDIILSAADDMIPQVQGYDQIIREEMVAHFPDTDGCLWFNDGYWGRSINTLAILGKRYYQRFRYIYNPIYKSECCDLEYAQVAQKLSRIHYDDRVIIRQERIHDALSRKNGKKVRLDNLIYERRLKNNFL